MVYGLGIKTYMNYYAETNFFREWCTEYESLE